MNIELDPELRLYVRQKVESGAFASENDVINGVLAAARAQEQLTAEDVAELRAMIAVGAQQADRGEVAPWDPVALKKRLGEQLARMKTP